MIDSHRVLAVVPARSGSKGIPDKNLQTIADVSLIGWAGRVLAKLPWVDARVISTDSPVYAEEARRYGLASPFLRPAALSTDGATAVETLQHALRESERHFPPQFDVILIIEPTSPFRQPDDVERAARRLLETSADSVVSVSPASAKFHPQKLLTLDDGRLRFLTPAGAGISNRQELRETVYFRNGVCYALTRACLLQRAAIFTENTAADIVTRPVVNIDDPIELEWARFLWTIHPPSF